LTQLIKVSQNDKILGSAEKNKAHQGKGILHRAFSIFIVDQEQKILIQQRSEYKKLWPGFWSNACCSHPRPGETVIQAGEKRLKEELGFTTKVKFIYKFHYRVNFKDQGSENELCYVLLGYYNGPIKINKKEVADYQWLKISQLQEDIKKLYFSSKTKFFL